jgi:2-C-methyl-D-erythritol 2,4-cyclodiphosphate synthase
VGNGYDAHRLTPGRPLILGGVMIPHSKGLLGHSDADALTHAVIDAMLGAAGLGDIGRHFPDTDEQYKGVSSLLLLRKTAALIREKKYKLVNLDCVIVAQKPKLVFYTGQMEENIAACVGAAPQWVNVKATTEEGMGFTGTEQGIAACAVCLLETMET